MAAGDTDGANDALDFAFDKQQLDDGSFPQNTQVDGRPKWTSTQMDQVGLPIVLAWQLNRARPSDWRHVRAAADFIVDNGPKCEQERWENQEGYSPATIAAEIAGLVCAADIARRNGDTKRAATYERKADSWQRNVERWTATTNGPYAPKPYYLRVTKDRKPDQGHDATRSATPALEDRPARASSTSPSSSSSGSASSARTTRRSSTRCKVVDRKLGRGLVLAPLLLRRLRRAPQRQVVASLR